MSFHGTLASTAPDAGCLTRRPALVKCSANFFRAGRRNENGSESVRIAGADSIAVPSSEAAVMPLEVGWACAGRSTRRRFDAGSASL